jgi:hypothetical protein
MLKGLLKALIFLSVFQVNAQEKDAKFPDDFFGVYKGDLKISNPKGEQTLQIEFHLQPTDSIGKYEYKLVYIADGNRQERDYTLIEKNAEKGEYIVDENNGILLDTKFVNNTLYAMFEVQGNILTTTERFYDEGMYFEITFSGKAKANTSQTTDEDPIAVISYPITVVQSAHLIKQ